MNINMNLSLYVLGYNEENKIADTSRSVNCVEEIVVIDPFSNDIVLEISKDLGAKVVQVMFEGFGKLRLAGIEHTSHDWILCTPKGKEEMLNIISYIKLKDADFTPRRSIFMGGGIRYECYPDYRQSQLFKRGNFAYESNDFVHEGYKVIGTTGYFKKAIIQTPFLSYSVLMQKMDRYLDLCAAKINENKSYSYCNISVINIWAFIQTYIIKLGIFDWWQGFVIAFCNIDGTFFKHAKHKESVLKKSETLND